MGQGLWSFEEKLTSCWLGQRRICNQFVPFTSKAKLNVMTNWLSKSLDHPEWELQVEVFHLLVLKKKISLSTIDLFAFHLNHKVSVLFTCRGDHRAKTTDCLLQRWPKEMLMYLPSIFLSSPEDQERSSTGNFAPFWPRGLGSLISLTWYRDLPSAFHPEGIWQYKIQSCIKIQTVWA